MDKITKKENLTNIEKVMYYEGFIDCIDVLETNLNNRIDINDIRDKMIDRSEEILNKFYNKGINLEMIMNLQALIDNWINKQGE